MKLALIALSATLALTAPLAAQADNGKGNGRGNDKHETYRDDRGPPGLAKKPYGLPPGQAKKMRWNRGDHLPAVYLAPRYYIAQPVQYRLSPAPYGYRWANVDGNYYLVQTRTGLITQTVAALLR